MRRWEVRASGGSDLRKVPSSDAAIIAPLLEGAVLTNYGCTDAEGEQWCEVRPFRGGARGFVPASDLLPAQGPDGTVPRGADDSKRRAGRGDFDARDKVACAQEQGQALGRCSAAVARGDGGDATVVVTFSNGFSRQLYFVHGEFVSASATMSGVGRDTDWSLEDGSHHIRVDDQRFQLSDGFVFHD
ncbi:MAG: hypothetical protein AAFS07_06730 [Pseudomonadota bacterium]